MSELVVNTGGLTGNLQQILTSEDIQPGAEPSYQLCKTVFLYHPLGKKMTETPIQMATHKPRLVSIPGAPKMALDAYHAEWKKLKCDELIAQLGTLARVYGIASIVFGAKGVPTNKPIPPNTLADLELYFNVLDPLNTSGSLVLNQDPNAPDFQKHTIVTAAGQAYHRSRSIVLMNEKPIYIAYTTSAFGFVGRSVYQRALFPLKSFIQTMITDDMVSLKVGLLVAKMVPAGPVTNKVMQLMQAIKRNFIKQGRTGQVLEITPGEDIETLNMQNVEGAGKFARDNILCNVALAADMPAVIISEEAFSAAGGFGEGKEDSKKVSAYIDGIRTWLGPAFDFFDEIVMARAWNPEFYKSVQSAFPEEFGDKGFTKALWDWRNAFHTEWPNLLTEPDSEKVKTEEVKFKNVAAMAEIMLPEVDPSNKVRIMQWMAANANENKLMFPTPLDLDWDALADYTPPAPPAEPGEPKPFDGES